MLLIIPAAVTVGFDAELYMFNESTSLTEICVFLNGSIEKEVVLQLHSNATDSGMCAILLHTNLYTQRVRIDIQIFSYRCHYITSRRYFPAI